jgi:hypothetical protein
MPYPIEANAALVAAQMVTAYMTALFGNVDFDPDDFVVPRGIGERGTPNDFERCRGARSSRARRGSRPR